MDSNPGPIYHNSFAPLTPNADEISGCQLGIYSGHNTIHIIRQTFRKCTVHW